MEYITQPKGQDSGVRPVEQIGFDLLRSLIAARQANCPTVRALDSAPGLSTVGPDGDTGHANANMALLTGRRGTESVLMGGAFDDRYGSAHTFAKKGESHG